MVLQTAARVLSALSSPISVSSYFRWIMEDSSPKISARAERPLTLKSL
jgi:hypothetical protein